jgi:hypothetical protein
MDGNSNQSNFTIRANVERFGIVVDLLDSRRCSTVSQSFDVMKLSKRILCFFEAS